MVCLALLEVFGPKRGEEEGEGGRFESQLWHAVGFQLSLAVSL